MTQVVLRTVDFFRERGGRGAKLRPATPNTAVFMPVCVREGKSSSCTGC